MTFTLRQKTMAAFAVVVLLAIAQGLFGLTQLHRVKQAASCASDSRPGTTPVASAPVPSLPEGSAACDRAYAGAVSAMAAALALLVVVSTFLACRLARDLPRHVPADVAAGPLRLDRVGEVLARSRPPKQTTGQAEAPACTDVDPDDGRAPGGAALASTPWDGSERRGPNRARNVVRPEFGHAPRTRRAADGTAGDDDWESF